MFSMHSRGDIIEYLESEGFRPDLSEDTEDLRASACLHAQVIAMQRSPAFREVMQNAMRILRKTDRQHADTIDRPADTYHDDDPFDGTDYGYDELF